MSGRKTATIETLTAKVMVVLVGSKQVTSGVWRQLDHESWEKITPFGRVRPPDEQPKTVYVIGAGENGNLRRSFLPTKMIQRKDWPTTALPKKPTPGADDWGYIDYPNNGYSMFVRWADGDPQEAMAMAEEWLNLPLLILGGLR